MVQKQKGQDTTILDIDMQSRVPVTVIECKSDQAREKDACAQLLQAERLFKVNAVAVQSPCGTPASSNDPTSTTTITSANGNTNINAHVVSEREGTVDGVQQVGAMSGSHVRPTDAHQMDMNAD